MLFPLQIKLLVGAFFKIRALDVPVLGSVHHNFSAYYMYIKVNIL